MDSQNSKLETQKCGGKVVVVSGPSGVGKSTICKGVADRLSNVYLSVSVTTRAKTESEVDGQDYRFISKQEFQSASIRACCWSMLRCSAACMGRRKTA